MSYEQVEQAVLAQVRSIDGFDESNTSISDWTLLDTGLEVGIIVQYKGFEAVPFTADGPRCTWWKISLFLIARFEDNSTVYELLREKRQAILDRFQQYHDLEVPATVFTSDIISGNFVELPESETAYLAEEIVCQVQELNPLRSQ